jgi:hypothetical protein
VAVEFLPGVKDKIDEVLEMEAYETGFKSEEVMGTCRERGCVRARRRLIVFCAENLVKQTLTTYSTIDKHPDWESLDQKEIARVLNFTEATISHTLRQAKKPEGKWWQSG